MPRLPLTVLPTALAEAGYEPVAYRRAYQAVVDARIPAKRRANGRWTFDPEDLPAIAESLGVASAYAA